MSANTTTAEIREKIQGWERGAAKLRVIVAKQEPLEYDSDHDGCESCFDPDTEEMQQLKMLEQKIDRWRTSLSFLEFYETQPQAVKDNDDVVAVWSLLRRRFEWASGDELRGYCATSLEKAALKAMYTSDINVHTFMCGLVHLHNRCPLRTEYLPREFVRAVVRLGLMNR
jgi:hypothetical protein